MTFNDARHLSRMTIEEIAEFLQLSIKTVIRYKTENKAPKAVITCLMLIGGFIPGFSKRNDFTAWSFGQGYLWSPEGERFTSGDIRAMRIDRELIRSQQVELQQIKSRSLVRESAQIIPFPSRNRNQELKA